MKESKLYRARDTAYLLYGKRYKKAILPYMDLIKETMTKFKLTSAISAASAVINKNKDRPSTGEILILAACCELLDPEENFTRRKLKSVSESSSSW